MFQRLKDLLAAADDLLGDPAEEERPHPHRQPVRIVRRRRPGTVPPRDMHCLSPVRPAPGGSRRDRVT